MGVGAGGEGIYGMIAYASSERDRDLATRMALGATRGDIFGLLAREGLIVAATGAAGMVIAYGTGRIDPTLSLRFE